MNFVFSVCMRVAMNASKMDGSVIIVDRLMDGNVKIAGWMKNEHKTS